MIVDALPAVNALWNATSATFLVFGWIAIKGGHADRHRRCMVAAFICSTLFLVGYLTRSYLTGTHRFVGADWLRGCYLVILFSHMILAAAVVPMVLRTLYLAWRKRFDAHRRIARWTLPIWLYVSVTGVLVYLMLYHLSVGHA